MSILPLRHEALITDKGLKTMANEITLFDVDKIEITRTDHGSFDVLRVIAYSAERGDFQVCCFHNKSEDKPDELLALTDSKKVSKA